MKQNKNHRHGLHNTKLWTKHNNIQTQIETDTKQNKNHRHGSHNTRLWIGHNIQTQTETRQNKQDDTTNTNWRTKDDNGYKKTHYITPD